MRFIASVASAVLLCTVPVFADTNVTGSIASATTWTVSGSPYIVTGDVTVNSNVTLTINPGVTVKFNGGRQLNINGTLSAVGTSATPIVFTSSSATPAAGDWNTLSFSSGSSASQVTYASVLYGGASSYAAVAVDNSSPSFDHVTVSNSSTSAMRITGSNTVPTVTNSTLSSNAWAGVEVTGSNGLTVSGTTWSSNGDYPIVADLNTSLLDLTNLTATGNGGGAKNAIGVRGGTINAAQRWRLSALPWEVTNNIDVGTNITLTIDPGVTVKFASGKQLGVLGKLTAVGTSTSPITFTSNAASPTAGAWNTIWFKSGSLSTSQISYASVLYAGNYFAGIFIDNSSPTLDHLTVSNSSAEGIRVTGSAAAPTITNSTLSSNSGYGINLTNGNGGTSATISGTTFTNNGNYAIGAEVNALLFDLSNLTATGNGSGAKNAIGYRGGVISTAERWPNSALPREVTSTVSVSNPGMSGTLTIDPGVTVKFASDQALQVYGTLTANGTAAAPITFTSNSGSPAPGSWSCIHYFAGSSGQMSYATVVYSGNSFGGIFIENSSPTFDHVTISSSRTAVYVNGASAPVFHHCQFTADTAGINNSNGSEQIDATLCYWNDATGPSGLGGGSGYSASGYVTFDPWLTVAPTSAQYISGATVQSRVFNPALSVFCTLGPSFAISGNWTVTILDATANTVLRTYTGTGTSASVTWDGKDGGGTPQPAGSYRFQIANTAPGNLVAATARGVLTLSNAAYVPTTAITSVTSGQTLSNVYQNGATDVSVVGSVRSTTLRNWILDYGAGSTPGSWTTLQSGTTEVNAAQIYLWPTISVTNGPYVLRLRSWDTAGNYSLVSLPITMGNFQLTQAVYELNVANSVTYTSIIAFPLTETVTLKNSTGSVVRTLVNAASRTAGTSTDSWNGRNDAGQVIADGLYNVVATVTDGSHSMTWDQSSQFFTTVTDLGHATLGNTFDPFNNQPLTFTYSTSIANKNTIFMSTVTPNPPNTCSPPAFCFTKFEESGSHTMWWAGVDPTGAFRPDIKTLAIVMFRTQFPVNGVVLFGSKPTISNLAVTPSVASVGTTRSITFTLGTYQNQTAAVAVAFQNQSSLSTLRTINVASQSPGSVSIAWDGRADNGMLVAPGSYTVSVTVTDAIGNQVSSQILTTIQN